MIDILVMNLLPAMTARLVEDCLVVTERNVTLISVTPYSAMQPVVGVTSTRCASNPMSNTSDLGVSECWKDLGGKGLPTLRLLATGHLAWAKVTVCPVQPRHKSPESGT